MRPAAGTEKQRWLRHPRLDSLHRCGAPVPLVPEALVPDAVAEVTGPDFPGERLMVCLNPRVRLERDRKREDLLQATEETLEAIAASVRSGRLKGRVASDRRAGRLAPAARHCRNAGRNAAETAVPRSRRHRSSCQPRTT